ncbi:MAG TPA: DPP IV N-terminal domain-containing protein, partial [Steroidobacteraceae bacterium]|nr:DPP IV N-terminal domain-containing protein [Steroidobacteraceae bacterium]
MLAPHAATAAPRSFTLSQVLEFPYASELTAAEHGDVIAWVRIVHGVRNIWLARAPGFAPLQLTRYAEDDGQELTHLTFSPDGRTLVYVRGGDHDANWPAEGHLQPDPTSSPEQPVMTIWSVPVTGGTPRKLAPGDAPAISARDTLAYIRDDQIWSVPLAGGKPERLLFDRGKDSDLHWSPDGRRLAFVSARGDHALIGVFTPSAQPNSNPQPILYLAPSTGLDSSPRWSFDGARIAFVRRPGAGGPPEPLLHQIPHPWAIWVASATDGSGHALWHSPETLAGSYPEVEGEANLYWAADDRLVFVAYLDDWPHLYSLPLSGGSPLLLTPGAYMVEHVAQSRDHRYMIFDANTGGHAGDADRRHLFRVPVDQPHPVPLTSGDGLEWTPVAAAPERVAFVSATAARPPAVSVVGLDGTERRELPAGALAADFPLSQLVTPRSVSFQAQDGTTAHGQLFDAGAAGAPRPAVIFVHGGPPRQMLLGWHYMRYYSNAYAVNQYLAAHGFVVLSVNYRLGIGYGRAFHQPEHA